MHVRVVVADERQVTFFDAPGNNAPLKERGALRNLSETSNVLTFASGRRSKRSETPDDFVRRAAQRIDSDLERHDFDLLVLVAEPLLLGRLRDSLSEHARQIVAAEINEDAEGLPLEDVRAAVPRALGAVHS